MRKLPLAFFSAAVLCALGGMTWGAIMGARQDFTLMPAHAHLNLVGWATLALMGGFYALSGKGGRLGWINFGFSVSAVVVMIPALAVMLGTQNPKLEPVVAGGSVLAILGMATFAISVLSTWARPTAEAEATPLRRAA
jgi:hypothetical protein